MGRALSLLAFIYLPFPLLILKEEKNSTVGSDGESENADFTKNGAADINTHEEVLKLTWVSFKCYNAYNEGLQFFVAD